MSALVSPATPRRLSPSKRAGETAESRFRDFIDTLPTPAWIVGAGSELLFANAAWANSVGGGSHLAINPADWLGAMHPDDRPLAQAAAARCVPFEIEARVRMSDETFRWWLFSATPHYPAAGMPHCFVGVCHDITGIRDLELQLRLLGTRFVRAQEGERSRIARELHDDLGHQVALLISRLSKVTDDCYPMRSKIRTEFSDLGHMAQGIAKTVHNIAHQLHPAKLTLLGLRQTLEGLCREVSTEGGVSVVFEGMDIPAQLSEDAELCIFRVAQEALLNAVRHSHARSIEMHFSSDSARATLRVIDDGTGFSQAARRSGGLGLTIMRERVDLLGGKLKIATSKKSGTRIVATIPIRAGTAA